jgi:transcriptional regulator with XRE-family HTH domain
MEQDDEKVAESAWRDEFRLRLKHIQGNRTQDDMAELLGVSRDKYNKYVNRGSAVPTRLLPRLAKIGGVSLEWLIEGPKNQEAARPAATKRKRA